MKNIKEETDESLVEVMMKASEVSLKEVWDNEKDDEIWKKYLKNEKLIIIDRKITSKIKRYGY